jgi:hypothetical protein
MIAKTLDEPDASPTIKGVMAWLFSIRIGLLEMTRGPGLVRASRRLSARLRVRLHVPVLLNVDGRRFVRRAFERASRAQTRRCWGLPAEQRSRGRRPVQ